MKSYTLETSVFSYILKKKKSDTLSLIKHFEKQDYTKQGVYKILRKFKQEQKIIWINKHLEINLFWLHREIENLSDALPRPDIAFTNQFATKKTYKVKTLSEMDDLYAQLFISIASSFPGSKKDFLFYDLHNYTYLHKIPAVEWYLEFLKKNQGETFLLVGSTSPLDLALKKKMKGLQMHCVDNKYFDHFIFNLGDHIIRCYLDKKILKKIDTVFSTQTIPEATNSLEPISHEKGTFKITVERNTAKAERIRKIFKKYFVLTR